MNASLGTIWSSLQPTLATLRAADWVLLILFGVSLLVVCAMRERFLAIWTAGWALLAVSRLAGAHGTSLQISVRFIPAIEQAAFVIAIGCFAGAVLVYTRSRNLHAPL